MALGLVVVAMGQIRPTETAARLNQAFQGQDSAASSNSAATSASPAGGLAPQPAGGPLAALAGPSFREVMALAGWDATRFAAFADDRPLGDEERSAAADLLRRLRTLPADRLAAWAERDFEMQRVVADSNTYRGGLLRLSGRLRGIAVHPLPSTEAVRLEMAKLYECAVELPHGERVNVVSSDVPDAWQQPRTQVQAALKLDEPVTFDGVFLKRLAPSGDEGPIALLAARRFAWYPAHPAEPHVSYGASLLGTLGYDVAMLDDIVQHGPVRAQERDAFYEMLAATGRVGANQLIRAAEGSLPAVGQSWSHELQSADRNRRILANEVVERAAKGRYSVAPLFNDADGQTGRLISVDGVARRIIRVAAGTPPTESRVNDAHRFGFDHYFEMEVYTDDSQNRPLVFCVRELPEGLPLGDDVNAPIRIAGFFFKSWRYQPRSAVLAAQRDGGGPEAKKQLIAPLLIGRGPVRLVTGQGSGGPSAGLVGGGLFILALAGIWAAAWWYARDDRRFRRQALAPRFSLPPGESLNDLPPTAGDGRPDLPTAADTRMA
jgi:hypothetical protein